MPGLAENRPSVLKGDTLIVAFDGKSFEGYVSRVEQEHVVLHFGQRFHASYVSNSAVDIRFKFKRMQLRTAHQAIDGECDAARYGHNLTRQTLFPSVHTAALRSPVTRGEVRSWYNRDLNEEQKAAVVGALRAVARPAPYVSSVTRRVRGVMFILILVLMYAFSNSALDVRILDLLLGMSFTALLVRARL